MILQNRIVFPPVIRAFNFPDIHAIFMLLILFFFYYFFHLVSILKVDVTLCLFLKDFLILFDIHRKGELQLNQL